MFICFLCFSDDKLFVDIYIATSGSKLGDGSINSPLDTVENALVLARKFKGQPVNIWLREGTYFIDKTIQLTVADNRTKKYPLVISAYQTENVILSGAKALPYWNKVVDSDILIRLPANAKKKVEVTYLRQYGITHYGSPKSGGVELYYNDKKMQIARYPNVGNDLLTIDKLVEPNTQIIRGNKGSKVGKFYYEGDRIDRWTNEQEIWLNGYWFWDWRDQSHAVSSIDTKKKIFELKKPYHHYGYRKGQEYFAFNVLAELDSQNEWYLDRDTGKLYFYPSQEIQKENLPMLAVTDNVIEFTGVSYITLKNLTITMAKNKAVSIDGGGHNVLDNLVINHIGYQGVTINDSANTQLVSSDIYSIGGSAITLKGGDRNSLTSANICVINNKIHDYATVIKTYQPGILIKGVGNCIKNNEIYDAPYIGIWFSGNNHSIENNNIHHVVNQSNDAGAIYAGRDWTSRGTIIKHNYLHDIQGYKDKGAKGIYLDDEFSGVTISGNIFDNVYDAVFIGGGRDNIVDNNLFINSFRSIYIDVRGIGWGKGSIKELTKKLAQVPHQSNIWKAEYPELANVLTENPRLPDSTVVSNNVFFDKKWDFLYPKAKPYVVFNNNHHLFGKKPTKKYQVNQILKGFSHIPFDEIGVK
jgi:hypothetical protein